MKAIMVMYDSLNRKSLSPYGGPLPTPNFDRLMRRSVTFDNSYICSMACMPARRELHTGRPNLLHRSWGPIEPFDDSVPEILKNNGIWTHLITDHYHYWEDGGATYHSRYRSYEFVRGQEGDPWKCDLNDLRIISNPHRADNNNLQDNINRRYLDGEDTYPQSRTFSLALEFLQLNHARDDWFLHVETFDPHEPWDVPEHYMEDDGYRGHEMDWPHYAPVSEPPEVVRHMKAHNHALTRMCDANLGRILDFMDGHDMWKETMLIVNTDHGFLLGEHGWWAKCFMPFYDEIAHTPLFIWDPGTGIKNERRKSLAQTFDLPATLLDYFAVARPADMLGQPLRGVIEYDAPVRGAGIFGLHGGQLCITDGRYTYFRSPDPDIPVYEYCHMLTRHGSGRAFVPLEELRVADTAGPFSFTKGCKLWRIPVIKPTIGGVQAKWPTALYDLANDPNQENPLDDPATEERLCREMAALMREYDAPHELYQRFGL